MSIQEILVSVDQYESSNERVKLAAYFADQFDSNLCGLHVTRPVTYAYYEAAIRPEIIEEIQQENKLIAEKAKSLFQDNTNTLTNKRFLELTGNLVGSLIREVSARDVLVIGQSSEHDNEPGIPEKVALSCGRPVVVVPQDYHFEPKCNNIMIAWNGKKEAVRAVNDALPWIASADLVKLVTIEPPKQNKIQTDAIRDHLIRHGANVDVVHIDGDDAQVPDILLTICNEENCQLLVMGAYGHSRLAELLLGGVTRSVLSTMKVPTLISH